MPISKKQFTKIFDNLQDIVDVDDLNGRSVPTNMNFVEEGFLTKDTGFTILGSSESTLCHSLFNYEKKNGTSFFIRGNGMQLEYYSPIDRQWWRLGTTTYTENAKFGFIVYDDALYGCNGVENYFKFDGTTFTEYASAPKGNILEIFEDRVFVSGVTAEPLSVYYSKTSDLTDFTVSSTAGGVIKPLGTDFVTNLKNYYGILMIFKYDSIWKLTFQYNSDVSLYVPKLELQSGNYGACSRKAVSWVENDLWFFTGREVRSIGFKDNQTGVFGVNTSVLSEQIKEVLYTISRDNYSKCVTGYNNRRFYLSVPVTATTADTTYVCHLLYNQKWTKYSGRDKSKIEDIISIDNNIYSSVSSVNFGVLKWNIESSDSTTLQLMIEINS